MKTANNYSLQQAISEPSTTDEHSVKSTFDNAILVEMIRSKSEKGFHILYDKYCGSLYNILIKIVLRTDVADDLLQETFVKIWKYIDRFDPAKGTLFTVDAEYSGCRNPGTIDYLRSVGYRQQLHENIDPFLLHVDCISTADINTNDLEFKDFKSNAMQLDKKYAEVIEMIYFHGWTQEQTARILDLPLGTVKTRARKGVEMLKIIYHQ